MVKTILKLHENGDFEPLDVSLIQSEIVGNYSFTENSITVPKIIEYPPANYRNYFIEKTSVPGVLYDGTGIHQGWEDDRTSDFIPVSGWESGVLRARFINMHGNYRAWIGILFYDVNKQYLDLFLDEYVSAHGQVGDFTVEIPFPLNVDFIRVSVNYYDSSTASVKLSVEKGTVATEKHYLAPEDLPEWVVDTGQPVSIFKEGIVLKGNLIHSPEVVFKDDFNRADSSTLGSDWEIVSGAYSIVNNTAKPPLSNGASNRVVVDVGTQNNIGIRVDIVPNVSEGIVFRYDSVGNFILAQLEGNTIALNGYQNGVKTTLISTPYSWQPSTTYDFRVELRNAEIKIFVNDELLITFNEPTFINTQKCGIHSWVYANEKNGHFDNFEVTRLM